ncbi:MAG: 1-deoxy-D-xylulose-5-phosphate reductoisomerase [Clostridia bacterium]|nr:1-deoxy-D-xylulose-5-phosphate reductoisomerase [Clostridia bacterium]
MKNLSILGSTGSIGTQALEVVDVCDDIKVKALSANSNIALLEQQIRRYKPDVACVADVNLYKNLKQNISDTNTKVVSGLDGMCEIATWCDSDMVLTSVVGNIGLVPTVEAIKNKKKILLANKETLVTSGSIIMPLAKVNGVDILPVDSEHSAIFQCLQGAGNNKIAKILLTASGGPFFGKTKAELASKTRNDALKHPNWSMGAKITIDSATLMNKGLEVIEAKWLFGVEPRDIEVYVHRQSIVHSMIEFSDRSVIAQMGIPDMKLPIVYAMRYPDRTVPVHDRLDLFKINTLTFEKPDYNTFDCLNIAFEAINKGGSAPTVMNAANEVAVAKFLNDEIGFLDIPHVIRKTIDAHDFKDNITLDDVLKLDSWARMYSKEIIL